MVNISFFKLRVPTNVIVWAGSIDKMFSKTTFHMSPGYILAIRKAKNIYLKKKNRRFCSSICQCALCIVAKSLWRHLDRRDIFSMTVRFPLYTWAVVSTRLALYVYLKSDYHCPKSHLDSSPLVAWGCPCHVTSGQNWFLLQGARWYYLPGWLWSVPWRRNIQ